MKKVKLAQRKLEPEEKRKLMEAIKGERERKRKWRAIQKFNKKYAIENLTLKTI